MLSNKNRNQKSLRHPQKGFHLIFVPFLLPNSDFSLQISSENRWLQRCCAKSFQQLIRRMSAHIHFPSGGDTIYPCTLFVPPWFDDRMYRKKAGNPDLLLILIRSNTDNTLLFILLDYAIKWNPRISNQRGAYLPGVYKMIADAVSPLTNGWKHFHPLYRTDWSPVGQYLCHSNYGISNPLSGNIHLFSNPSLCAPSKSAFPPFFTGHIYNNSVYLIVTIKSNKPSFKKGPRTAVLWFIDCGKGSPGMKRYITTRHRHASSVRPDPSETIFTHTRRSVSPSLLPHRVLCNDLH